MKDNNVIFRCDDYEFAQIKALPYLLEEYVPGVSFNRSRSLNYAVAFLFREVSKAIYEEKDNLQSQYKNVEAFRNSLLKQVEEK